MKLSALPFAVAAIVAALAAPAQAAVIISEVVPWGSGTAPISKDWFEVTNTGAAAVTVTGWKMDDDSNAFGSAAALAGITSIAAGESVIFIEGGTPAANTTFLNTWFGANAPVGLQIGSYTGQGVGLSTGGDAVNLFNAAGVLQAKVTFGASDAVSPLQTFDNAAGLNNTAISQLSVVGTNGAFVAANDIAEIGSPGTIAAVPEPEGMVLAALGLLAIAGQRVRRRQA